MDVFTDCDQSRSMARAAGKSFGTTTSPPRKSSRRRRHIVVVFKNCLFGEAIARVLREDDQLRVTTLSVDALSREALRGLRPHAIVLEESLVSGDVRSSLLGAGPALTVVVGPQSNTAEVYARHEVIEATASAITARMLPERAVASAGVDPVREPLQNTPHVAA